MRRLTLLVALVVLVPTNAHAAEGCQAPCTYTAAENGGIGGYGAEPGGWKVTIVRKRERIVITSSGGAETYACGAIQPKDKVTATADEGSGVFIGNPGIC